MIVAQRHVHSAQVLLQLLQVAGTDERHDDPATLLRPGDRHLRRRAAKLVRHGDHLGAEGLSGLARARH